eukprot:CAMPEP_0113700848 /NCGR_PEP_ID=MMETSP0038_2-20120614/24213_1 /TAXON_ID=2898 /ORGANISM="Cryptomonas paramecium" /LENGTH=198 /DNA_ID=CAMNT_0000624607 /DNA_START=188 /DNA_END=784 /DNA_ORIENTATION=+ /assembly_acc=CAM_ASM_000170
MSDKIVSPFDPARKENIVSPFDPAVEDDDSDDDEEGRDSALLPLTRDNVELVLDKMRPYLLSDGGNVKLVEISGGVVRLKLEGACGTCPSSSMTMKMGLEKGLKERIPDIMSVIQDYGDDLPPLDEAEVEKVLDTVRPFLKVAGGDISLKKLHGVGGLQPTVVLNMTGSSAALRSVRNEIMQRILRKFQTPNLHVDFV